jgi:thiol-disulfide isomerase/thioredoxin
MKRTLVYIAILLLLFIAAGFFLQFTGRKNPVTSLLPSNVSTDNKAELAEPSVNTPIKFVNNGPAPEFSGIDKWLNSNPLKLADLRGKVVLVDFWTYSCINCIRTLPYVTKWYDTYKDQGFVVIGVHTPEFAFEKVTANVETALKRYNINYPVGQDNNYKTWLAYNNQFWPAHYLIDQQGNIVYTHFGEGEYDTTERAIRSLLGLDDNFIAPNAPETNSAKTREIYFGLAREENFGGSETLTAKEQIFTFPKKLGQNKFALEGTWSFDNEKATLKSNYGRIRLNFDSAKVFIVAQSSKPVTLNVKVDGKVVKGVVVKDSQLYTLFESDAGGPHTLEIEITNSGFEAFTFTFG